MNINARTITVNGTFGDKEMTRREFINVWWTEAKNFKNITWSEEWAARVNTFMADVEEQAGKEFDSLYEG